MKQIRVKMTKDHEVNVDANTTRKFPKGIVFGLPENQAREFVSGDVAAFVSPDDAEEAAKLAEKPDDGFEKMKKADLEALAKERNIDLGEAKTKEEIIEVLRKAPVT